MDTRPKDDDSANDTVWPPAPSTEVDAPPKSEPPPVARPVAQERQAGAYLGMFCAVLSMVIVFMLVPDLLQASSLVFLERLLIPLPIHLLIAGVLWRRRRAYGIAYGVAAILTVLLIFVAGLYMIKSEL